LEPPPDVEDVEDAGAGVEEVVEEVELSFDDDELSFEPEAPSEALALFRLSVR
jgi:hypothetical protein